MITIILADAEMELIPENLLTEVDVLRDAKRRNKLPRNMLLEASMHHHAIKKGYPNEVERRGRPDIVFQFMLLNLDSVLNYEHKISIYVHTRNDEVITINPKMRPPKNYNRFLGLMESLFQNNVLPDKQDPLLKMEKGSLKDLINKIKSKKRVIVLSPAGTSANIKKKLFEDGDVIIIGGFSNGDYKSEVKELGNIISIYPQELTVWGVLLLVHSNIYQWV
ncbi:MAG: 16S rRNA methyltransferase [Thermoplasmata archaeon]